MLCPECRKEIDDTDTFCKFCGAIIEKNKPIPWYLKGWFIIIMAFVVLGPFALPLLWKSPDFKRQAKVILTIVIIIYTLILLIIPNLYLRRIYSNILRGYQIQ